MTVGERLREARERQKVSLHTIAETTNISVRFLDAIEKGQYGKLPGGIFTRGFIRSYAAQVGVDPDAAVDQFLADEPGHRDDTDDGGAYQRQGPNTVVLVGGGIVALLLLVAALYALAPDWLRPGSGSTATAPHQEPAQAGDATGPGPESAAAPAPPPVDSPSTDVAAQAPVPPPAQDMPAPATAVPESPRAPLHLVVAPSGRCWVQVSADGQMRLARELNAGDRVTVEAAERLQIVAGDAGAFAYELNGRPGRSLGAAGAVARATILPSTASQFQAP